jgi:hypothetical protein
MHNILVHWNCQPRATIGWEFDKSRCVLFNARRTAHNSVHLMGLTMSELERELREKLTVPLWPTAAQALGLGRNATYKAAAKGELPGVYRIGDKIMVATAPLRRVLGLDEKAA